MCHYYNFNHSCSSVSQKQTTAGIWIVFWILISNYLNYFFFLSVMGKIILPPVSPTGQMNVMPGPI